jgi:hypothetical protein
MVGPVDLGGFSREIEEARLALDAIHGRVGTVRFNPAEPASVAAAIAEMERRVDEQMRPFAANSFVGPMAEAMKEKCREAIHDRAVAARLQGE